MESFIENAERAICYKYVRKLYGFLEHFDKVAITGYSHCLMTEIWAGCETGPLASAGRGLSPGLYTESVDNNHATLRGARVESGYECVRI